MKKYRKQTRVIHNFILVNVEKNPMNITTLTAKQFNISRSAVLRHIQQLINNNLLSVKGITKDRSYSVVPSETFTKTIPITSGLEEDVIWRNYAYPIQKKIPKNVLDICHYGFTEMVNNVIDHADGKSLIIKISYSATKVTIWIMDDGIGIFRNIRTALNLENDLHAVLELSKGKLTTDPENHTGEGIFFTSRVFDEFELSSNEIFLKHFPDGEDMATEIGNSEKEKISGTTVCMKISPNSKTMLQNIFNEFSSEYDEFGFSRTVVPVHLAKYGEENLISRSQAKRLLVRFDKFREVILNFKNVEIIGQAFADEIFRVFVNKNPNTHLSYINTNEQVKKMILRVTGK
jgi:anti-sigma regulatory factor (Ser/Thr protein kinase)